MFPEFGGDCVDGFLVVEDVCFVGGGLRSGGEGVMCSKPGGIVGGGGVWREFSLWTRSSMNCWSNGGWGTFGSSMGVLGGGTVPSGWSPISGSEAVLSSSEDSSEEREKKPLW